MPLDRISWETFFILATFFVIVLPTVPCKKSEVRLSTRLSGLKIFAENVWYGGDTVTFEMTIENQTNEWVPSAIDDSFPSTVLSEVSATQPYGFDKYKTKIFPTSGGSTIVLKNITHVVVRMFEAVGFVIKEDLILQASNFGSFVKKPGVGNEPDPVNITIVRNRSPGMLSLPNTSSNEFAIRRSGLAITLRLLHNRFVTSQTISLASTNAQVQSLSGQWASTYSNEDTQLTLTLPRKTDFDISEAAYLNMSVATSVNTYLGLVDDEQLSPSNFLFTINAIDGSPLSYCRFLTSEITEDDLRNGRVFTFIELTPQGADAFVVSSEANAEWNEMLNTTAEISMEAIVLNESFVMLNISARNQTSFNVDNERKIVVVPPADLLDSGEVGCGSTFLPLVASPGLVTCTQLPGNVSEVDINDKSLTFNFSVAYDSFVEPLINSSTEMIELTEIPSGIDYAGFVSYVASSVTVEIAPDGLSAVVRIPQTPRYNIPPEMVEAVTFTFPQGAMKSGLAPHMPNATFNITAFAATLSASFDSCHCEIVTAEQLWAEGAVISLTLRGAVWNEAGASSWNAIHPEFDGASDDPDAFDHFHDPTKDIYAVRYSEVSISLRTAWLPLDPMPGLSIEVNELVYVQMVYQLIPGRAELTVMEPAAFSIQRAKASSIEVTWGGVAATGAPRLQENDVRQGFWFTINLTNAVFASVSQQNLTQLFPSPMSFAPYLSRLSMAMLSRYCMNISMSPVETYDIDTFEIIALEVPNFFYLYQAPPVAKRASIAVEAARSPSCAFFDPVSLSEADVRQGGERLVLKIEVISDDFVSTEKMRELNVTLNTTFQPMMPLHLQFEGIYSASRASFAIVQNASYDIIAEDRATISFSRFWFKNGESCTSADKLLNFTIAVLPGRAYVILPDAVNESSIREGSIPFQLVIIGEKVVTDVFNVTVLIDYSSQESLTGFGSILRSLPTKKINATRDPFNSSVFRAEIPQHKFYDIAVAEQVRFEIPASAVASGKPPMISGNVLTITPTPAKLNATFDESVIESRIVEGGYSMTIKLDFDSFIVPDAVTDILDTVVRRGVNGAPASGALDFVPMKSFKFVGNDNKTLQIDFVPDVRFDVVQDEWINVTIPPEALISNIAPVPSTLSIRVLAGASELVPSGSALFASSRLFVLGGLYLQLYLLNDRFVESLLLARDLCPYSECMISVDSVSLRNVTVTYLPSASSLFLSNTTYTIQLPPGATASGSMVNNITLFVYVQSGVVDISFLNPPSVITEDLVRLGRLPRLLISVRGDQIVGNAEAVVESLSANVECTPPSDEFGFCSRARFIITQFSVLFYDEFLASVQPQADENYDIYRDTGERVNVSLGRTCVQSGQHPIGSFAFDVLPARGSVYFSPSYSRLQAQDLAVETEKNIELTFVLHGERWIADPTDLVINGFHSSSNQAREPNGFERWKRSLFNRGRVSSDFRVLTLTFRPVSQYTLFREETITFTIEADAVMSKAAPLQGSASNSIVIEASGGRITITTPTLVPAETVRDYGLNVTLESTDEWDRLFVNSKSISKAFQSDVSPADEPYGFNALRESMLPQTAEIIFSTLSLALRPNAKYRLKRPEVIRLAVPDNWGNSKKPVTPSTIEITVSPELHTIVAIVRKPFDSGDFIRDVAVAVGLTTDQVSIEAIETYGAGGRADFAKVRFVLKDSPVQGTRDAQAAADFYFAMDPPLLEKLTNISVTFYLSSPLAASEIDQMIGVTEKLKLVVRENDLLWVWLSLIALGIAAIAGIVYYRIYVQRALYSGMNRPRPELGEHFILAAADDKPILLDPPELTERQAAALTAKRRVPPARPFFNVPDDETSDEEMPTLCAQTGGPLRRIDVDEMLHSGQPKDVLAPRIPKINLSQPVKDTVEDDMKMTIYPTAVSADAVPRRRFQHQWRLTSTTDSRASVSIPRISFGDI